MEDIFVVIVDHVDHDHSRPASSVVEVLAPSSLEASLIALEMVAARDRVPVAARVDWDRF